MAETRLEAFLKARKIKPAALARESGVSRPHLHTIRMGKTLPNQRGLAAIAAACRRLSGEDVRAAQLFDLNEEET